jgi:hypothetical protein
MIFDMHCRIEMWPVSAKQGTLTSAYIKETNHSLVRSDATRTKYATLHFPEINAEEQFSSSTTTHTVGCLAPYSYYQNTVNHSTKFSNKRKFTIHYKHIQKEKITC